MESRTAYSTWTPQKPTLFDGHYLRNRSTLDIGVLGHIGIVQHKEHSPEVLSIPSGTSCIRSDKILFLCFSFSIRSKKYWRAKTSMFYVTLHKNTAYWTMTNIPLQNCAHLICIRSQFPPHREIFVSTTKSSAFKGNISLQFESIKKRENFKCYRRWCIWLPLGFKQFCKITKFYLSYRNSGQIKKKSK